MRLDAAGLVRAAIVTAGGVVFAAWLIAREFDPARIATRCRVARP